jgi:hypothetical protein
VIRRWFAALLLIMGVISWTPPTTNADGTPLTDLAGYKVYCGTSSRKYDRKKNTGNVVKYDLKPWLTDGYWYCAVTAYDTSGNESVYSNEVNFRLDRVAPDSPW